MIAAYEKNGNWMGCYSFLKSVENSISPGERLNLFARVMFLTACLLAEEDYSKEDAIYGKSELKALFTKSFKEFKNNYDFLFCLSVIASINPGAFGLEAEDSDKFLDKAIKKSNGIKLYLNWFLVVRKRIPVEKDYLDCEFVKNWVKEKGLLGNYVIGCLRFEDFG